MSGRLAFVLACTTACSYPEFAFDPNATEIGAADTSIVDSAVAETVAPQDSSMMEETSEPDTFVADSEMPDTFVADTTVVDTFVPDTFVADTFVADTKPLGFCASSSHFFCNDFDSSTEVTYGWTGPYYVGSGALTLGSTSKSAPRALRSTITAPSSTSFDAATVARAFDAPTADAITRYEADIMLDTATYAGVQGTLLLKLQRSGGAGVGIGIDPDGLYVEIVGTSYTWKQLVTKPAAATWFHVKVETKLVTTGGFVKVWINDVLDQDLSSISTIDTETTSRSIVVGLYADTPISTFGARFDNVTVDFP